MDWWNYNILATTDQYKLAKLACIITMVADIPVENECKAIRKKSYFTDS